MAMFTLGGSLGEGFLPILGGLLIEYISDSMVFISGFVLSGSLWVLFKIIMSYQPKGKENQIY